MDIPSTSRMILSQDHIEGTESQFKETKGTIVFEGYQANTIQSPENYLNGYHLRLNGTWHEKFPSAAIVELQENFNHSRFLVLNKLGPKNIIQATVNRKISGELKDFLTALNRNPYSDKIAKWNDDQHTSKPCSPLSKNTFKRISPSTAFVLYVFQIENSSRKRTRLQANLEQSYNQQVGGIELHQEKCSPRLIQEGPLSLIPELLYVRALSGLEIESINKNLQEISSHLADGFDRSSREHLIPTICFLSYALSKKINTRGAEVNNHIEEIVTALLRTPKLEQPESAGIYYGLVRSSLLYAVYRMAEDTKKIKKYATVASKIVSIGLSGVQFPGAGSVASAIDPVVHLGVKYYTQKYLITSTDFYFKNRVLDFINSNESNVNFSPMDDSTAPSGSGPTKVDRFKKWYDATIDLSTIEMINHCKIIWKDRPVYQHIDNLKSGARDDLISICGTSD